MVEASCHCGKIKLEIDIAPDEVTDCNCSICRRYGTLWAYYQWTQVRLAADGATDTYQWDDKAITFHRCSDCGCVVCWDSAQHPRQGRMGVNARLLKPDVLAPIRVFHLDGASHGGYTH